MVLPDDKPTRFSQIVLAATGESPEVLLRSGLTDVVVDEETPGDPFVGTIQLQKRYPNEAASKFRKVKEFTGQTVETLEIGANGFYKFVITAYTSGDIELIIAQD